VYVPDSAIRYRYYLTANGRLWFSTDCQQWTQIDVPYSPYGWELAKPCDGGPVVLWSNDADWSHYAREQTLAVSDLSSF
jgi:hypothetical protein